MLVSAVINRLKKLESIQCNGMKLKIFFHNPTDIDLALLDKDYEVFVFLDEDLEE